MDKTINRVAKTARDFVIMVLFLVLMEQSVGCNGSRHQTPPAPPAAQQSIPLDPAWRAYAEQNAARSVGQYLHAPSTAVFGRVRSVQAAYEPTTNLTRLTAVGDVEAANLAGGRKEQTYIVSWTRPGRVGDDWTLDEVNVDFNLAYKR